MINILSKETIDKIAAGEVAERPESVVKELMDNAIDSGADTISIEVRNGGLDLIRVTDNGSGIEKADVRNAFLRHATSKLKTADDIEHIRSMGFRGEALASIAAVSEVELITKNVNELTGTQYRIEDGRERSFKEIGVPQGTTVIVRNFLMNVPVRRQFLKSPQTETAYIVNTVEKLALAYTDIAFSLNVDGKNTFSSTGNGRLKDVIYQIYGREAAASLLEVDSGRGIYNLSDDKSNADAAAKDTDVLTNDSSIGSARIQNTASNVQLIAECAGNSDAAIDTDIIANEGSSNDDAKSCNTASNAQLIDECAGNSDAAESHDAGNAQTHGKREAGSSLIRVHGYAARPVIARSRRDYEVFFVNGRWIQSDILRKAAEDAYAPYMMQHKYPMFILHIDLAPEGVDVNVHPRKREVRFSSNKLIYDAVYDTLTKVLHDAELIVDAGNAYFLKDKKRESSVPSGRAPEAFEKNRQYDYVSSISEEIAKNSRKDEAYISSTETAKSGMVGHGVADMKCDIYQTALSSENQFNEAASSSEDKLNGNLPTSAGRQKEAVNGGKVFINKSNLPYFKMIGQVFETYWIIEYNDEMYIIDQHAAHEKVNFEHFMALIRSHEVETQMIFPPIVLTLSAREAALFDKFIDEFVNLGYEIEYAGDRDYIVRGVPSNLPQLADEEVLRNLIDSLFDEARGLNSELIHDKIASMSCKAAIKGNMNISETEMRGLIAKLLTLENPYACPHGRPTIIKWSRTDLDRLFKRIVS